MNYENETCEACLEFYGSGSRRFCAKTDMKQFRTTKACDRFIPSLECRKVRALESIATKGVRNWTGCKWDVEVFEDCPVFNALGSGCHDCEYWGGYETP